MDSLSTACSFPHRRHKLLLVSTYMETKKRLICQVEIPEFLQQFCHPNCLGVEFQE